MQRQLDVGADDVVLQFQLRQARLGHTHMGQIHRAFTGIALAAPEVEGVTEAERGVVVPCGGIGQFAGAVELIGWPVVALEGRLAIDLQRLGRFGNTGHGLGLTHPRSGHGHARAALHGEVDPAIKLRVTKRLPPLGAGPVGVFGGLGNGSVGGQ